MAPIPHQAGLNSVFLLLDWLPTKAIGLSQLMLPSQFQYPKLKCLLFSFKQMNRSCTVFTCGTNSSDEVSLMTTINLFKSRVNQLSSPHIRINCASYSVTFYLKWLLGLVSQCQLFSLKWMGRSCTVFTFHLWVMNCFPPYNPLLTDKASQASRCSFAISMESVQTSFLSSTSSNLHGYNLPYHTHYKDRLLFPSYSIGEMSVPLEQLLLTNCYFVAPTPERLLP